MSHLLAILFILVSCTNSSESHITHPNNDQSPDPSAPSSRFSSIISQSAVLSADQISFNLMPVNDLGEPLNCEQTEINYNISTFYNGERLENQAARIECIKNHKSQVGIVIDNSGSIRNHRLTVQKSVESIVDELVNIGSSISMTEVHTNASLLLPLSNDKTKIMSSLQRMQNSNGWTSLYDGIRLSHESLREQNIYEDQNIQTGACSQSNKAVILLTDGIENNSSDENYESYDLIRFPGDKINTTLEDIRTLKDNHSQIPIYTLGIGDEISSSSLGSISMDSKGLYRKLDHYSQIDDAFENIGKYLRSPHKVCIESDNLQCGDYKIVIDYTSEYGPDGQSEITLNIPCEVVEESEELETITTTFEEVETINTDNTNELTLQFDKIVEYPLFDDQNGKRELVDINLNFQSEKILKLDTEPTQIQRQSHFYIHSNNKDIINLERVFDSNQEAGLNFEERQQMNGSYRISSQYYSQFIGKGYGSLYFSALDELNWEHNNPINGTLRIMGNFVIEYIWRYKTIPGVMIPDPNLRSAIRLATNTRVGPITPESMLQITQLNLSNKEITNYQGIEFASNLKTLNIYNTNTRDISFIKALINIEELNLGNNPIQEYAYLESLTQLKSLKITDSNFSDSQILSKMTGLTSLEISNSQVSNISFLNQLISLEEFKFQGCDIQNYSYLEKAISLKTIDMYNCKNNPAFTLKLNSNMAYSSINFNRTQLTSLAPFANKSISSLNISQNSIESFAPISTIRLLRTLNSYSNEMTNNDYSLVIQLPEIRTLNLSNNNITQINTTIGNNTLKNLYLSNNQISDISAFILYTQLTQVNISSSLVTDLSPLLTNLNLAKIIAQNIEISDINILRNIQTLEFLDLKNTIVPNSIDFSNFPSLKNLYLRDSSTANISFIENPLFRHLDFRNNEVTCDIQKEFTQKQYQGYDIRYTPIADCPYQYIIGATFTSEKISEALPVGFQFFGEFDSTQYFDEMSASYNVATNPLVLTSDESLENFSITVNLDINYEMEKISQQPIDIELEHSIKISLSNETQLLKEEIIQFKNQHLLTSDLTSFQEYKEMTLSFDSQITTSIMNSSDLNIKIDYSSSPLNPNNTEQAYNVDNRSSGMINIDYQVLRKD